MKRYNTPRVKESRGVQVLTTIWLVPLMALAIALWLAYQYYIKIGPTITIRFKSNAGLIENQSPIKIRDVTVGLVKEISLSDDGKGVIIRARMNRVVEDYLNESAKFWIVHPDVGSNGIYGLDTIVSGSYIELYGVKGRRSKLNYTGLEHPYIDNNAKGKYLLLSAPQSYNISERGILYYRMLEIGKVERVEISPDGTCVYFTVFIEEDYVKYINNDSRFYARSNINIDVTKGAIDVGMAPFRQLMHGGITLYTPIDSIEKNVTLSDDKIFYLYKNYAQMRAKQLGVGGDDIYVKMVFDNRSNSLKIGTPIEFKSFQVGTIIDIKDRFNRDSREIDSVVDALIHKSAFELNSSSGLISLIEGGLSAKVKSDIPFMGIDHIELFFGKARDGYRYSGGLIEIPTVKVVEGKGVIDNLNDLILQLQQLPLKDILDSARAIIDDNRRPINNLIKHLDSVIKRFAKSVRDINRFTSSEEFLNISANINNLLGELELTLLDIQKLTREYGENSKFGDQLSLTLESISEASRSFDKTNRILQRNPNALLVGDN